jgi:hypothetical protein
MAGAIRTRGSGADRGKAKLDGARVNAAIRDPDGNTELYQIVE